MLTLFALAILAMFAFPKIRINIKHRVAMVAFIAFAPALAFAQATAPAASPGIVATIEAFIAAHVTFALIIAGIPVALGFVAHYLSSSRKDQIATGVDVAFYFVENLKQQLAKAGKTLSGVEKADAFLKALNDYMVSNGWRELKPTEQRAAQIQADALHAQLNMQEKASVSPDAAAAALGAVK